jgi:hypothetical protein
MWLDRSAVLWLMNQMRGTDALQPDRLQLPKGNTGESISLSRTNRSPKVSDTPVGGAAAQSFL